MVFFPCAYAGSQAIAVPGQSPFSGSYRFLTVAVPGQFLFVDSRCT